MRLVTYTFRGTTRLGALVGDAEVVDLNRACALHRAERGERRARALADFLVPPDMPAFLQAGDPAMDAARAALAHVREHLGTQRDAAIASGLLFRTDEPGFRLEAPVPRPGKVLAVGVNYKDHAEEAKIPLPERPIIFAKLPSCVIGTGAPIHRPRVSTKLDFEGELCVVIGKHARHVAAADADTYVAGYMVGNDVSVRDWQFHSPTWIMGKSFDTHGPTGPWLVTRDEVPDPGRLQLRPWSKGDVPRHGTLSERFARGSLAAAVPFSCCERSSRGPRRLGESRSVADRPSAIGWPQRFDSFMRERPRRSVSASNTSIS